MNQRIPFNKPHAVGKEFEYMQQALRNNHTCGNGPFTKKCCEFLEKTFSLPRALLTTSCTHALEMAALLLEIKAGDEVVFPPFTFVSTVNAFVLRGAVPVFCDIRPDTLNMDERLLESHVSSRTRAIVPVHYAGVGCEMDVILSVSQKHNIPVVEDNAHGLFGKYKGKFLGTFGCLATQSFHETKNFNCGEGGALLINEERFASRAEIILEKGTDRSRFFRGQVDKYTWVDVGSSYLPSDLLTAYLLAQFEHATRIQEKRRALWEYYNVNLKAWADGHGVRLPIIPRHCDQAYHMFYLLMPSLIARQALIAHLAQRGIVAVFHYLPLHLSQMGKRMGGVVGQCPVTEDVSDRLVRLAFYNDMTQEEIERVCEGVKSFVV